MFPGPVAYRTKRGDVSVIPAASTRLLFVVKLDGLGPAAQAEHLRDPVSVALFLRGHWCRSARFDPVVLAGFGDHSAHFLMKSMASFASKSHSKSLDARAMA